MKKNEGITLIALIITIIILVILAAVSITAVTQGNIIGWSSDAAAKYIDQANSENTTLSEFESKWLSVNSALSSTLGGGGKTLSALVTEDNYGDYVDYPVDLGIGENGTKDDWKLFYKKDDGKIFIIAADYVPNTNSVLTLASGKADMTQRGTYVNYWSSAPLELDTDYNPDTLKLFSIKNDNALTNYTNSYCVSKLLTTKYWEGFVDDAYAECAVGGPTLEMWCEAWNAYLQVHPDESFKAIKVGNGNTTGYNVSSDSMQNKPYLYMNGTQTQLDSSLLIKLQTSYSLFFPHTEIKDGCNGYWLTSPSAFGPEALACGSSHDGCVSYCGVFGTTGMGLRPVVCLNSGVSATYDEGTKTYTLSK